MLTIALPLLRTRKGISLLWMLGAAWFFVQFGAWAGESWPEVLSRMPLQQRIPELNRTNCVEVILGGFQSNQVVKALIFLPGATDEFYMFGRARAQVINSEPSLWDAVNALTNQTRIRATFRSPMLLLHTEEDLLEAEISVRDERTADQIRQAKSIPHIFCNDRDWDFLQPLLRRALKMDIRPWRKSTDSWHFYRHSFAAWGLNGWEGLEAAALASKTKFTVRRKALVFELDRRVRGMPPS